MRYFTKSLYKLALECPTKLFYTKKPTEYSNRLIDDPFLKALAKGGFQVGELAKLYHPSGIEVKSLDITTSLQETNELLMNNENVIIYEAAFKYKNLFARVDILEKRGSKINLIEVKAKSFNGSTFLTDIRQKRNISNLSSTWMPYLYDVAYQTYIAKEAFPQYEVIPYLMCADKEKITSIDGLNQKILVRKNVSTDDNNNRMSVILNGHTTLESLGTPILTAVEVSNVVNSILKNEIANFRPYKDLSFQDSLHYFADRYVNDEKIANTTGTYCKNCEFRSITPGLKSGFNECWKVNHNLDDAQLTKPLALDVWFSPVLLHPRIFMEDIYVQDLGMKPSKKQINGLSRTDRQWLQIKKTKNNDSSEYIDKENIKKLFATFKYPLHFIDFETSMVAIPFTKGRKPYEIVAFQFSHHVINVDDSYHHAGEWISTTPGKFPNYDFVRALKKELENDNGTIFRYSSHENTVLNQIQDQLLDSNEPDRDDLINWMKSITSKSTHLTGDRNMVDLCDIVKKYYYHPDTKGSNSIKQVLPAILKAQGKDPDPYGALPPMFEGYDTEKLNFLNASENEDLADGGAAMTAYAMTQFTEMSNFEREIIQRSLRRYCKLDTEAMVLIYQYLCKKSY